MWTTAILQTRDELQKDAVDSVANARLVPVGVKRMFLALVQNECSDVVVVNWAAGKVEVTVTKCLEHAETTSTTASGKQ